MNEQQRPDKLLRRLLTLVETTAVEMPTEPDEHLEDETLARFAAAELSNSERNAAIEHLASCTHCREIVSDLLKHEVEEQAPTVAFSIPAQRSAWRRAARPLLAAAATVVAALGLGYWIANPRLTEETAYRRAKERLLQADYSGVQRIITSAEGRGLHSARLHNLNAQAGQRIPAEVSLAFAGRLGDFGYDVGGIAAREVPSQDAARRLEQAEQLLIQAEAESLPALLNRGEIFLRQGKYSAAAEIFDTAVQNHPREPSAWLGKGLAAFLQDDFLTAEAAFRRCREVDPGNAAATINLAMTLEEQDQTEEAQRLWRDALPLLSPDERPKIERHLKDLEGPMP